MYVYGEKALSANTVLVNSSRTLNALYTSKEYFSFTSVEKMIILWLFSNAASRNQENKQFSVLSVFNFLGLIKLQI